MPARILFNLFRNFLLCSLWTCLSLILTITNVSAQIEKSTGIRELTLPSGLEAVLVPDKSAGGVYAGWVVRAGSKHDPPNLPGTAEVLRRMIQTGNDTLGTLDFKRESIPLKKLKELNDKWAQTASKTEREILLKEMVRLSNLAAEYAVPAEMNRLTDAMGAKIIAQKTGFEATVFFHHIPSHILPGWLSLVKERMKMPSFRMYLHEKEKYLTRTPDFSSEQALNDSLTSYIFHKNQYGNPPSAEIRPPDGFPTLSQLADFHQKYYVPGNMALVLCGDFDPENTEGLLMQLFSVSETDSLPGPGGFAVYKQSPLKGRQNFNISLGPTEFYRLSFTAPGSGHADVPTYHLLKYLLSNELQTGVLDTLVRKGKLKEVAADLEVNREFSVFHIDFRPEAGISLKAAEELLRTAIDSFKRGGMTDTSFSLIRRKACTDFYRNMRYASRKADMFMEWLSAGTKVNRMWSIPEKWTEINRTEALKTAQRIFTDKYFLFSVKPYLQKSGIKTPERELPLKYLVYNRQSRYAKNFLDDKNLSPALSQLPDDYKDKYQELTLGMNQKVYYVEQKDNPVFRLTVRYEVGQDHYKSLEVIVRYLKEVGTLKTARERWRQQMESMECKYDFGLKDQYFEINLEGNPRHFYRAAELLTELVFFHERNQFTLQKVIDQIEAERKNVTLNTELFSDMVKQYLLHKSASPYRKRLNAKALERMDVINLRDTVRRITSFPVSFHYVGRNQLTDIHTAANRLFQLPKRSLPAPGRAVKKIALYKNSTVLFYHDPKAESAHIHFYVPGALLSTDSLPALEAFNRYFGQDEQSLLVQNLIENKGIARKAEAGFESRHMAGYRGIFTAYLNSPNDKVTDAVKETVLLIKNMPLDSIRIPGLKTGLINSCYVTETDGETLTREVEKWGEMGYSGHPGMYKINSYRKLNIARLTSFYKIHLKGKPIAIAIVGNKKYFKPEELKNFGKIQFLKLSDIVTY